MLSYIQGDKKQPLSPKIEQNRKNLKIISCFQIYI